MKKLLASCLILIMLLSLCGLSSAEGTVRKLPIDLTGGAPLQTKFDGKMTVYEDPSIRVERDKVSGSKWGCTLFVPIFQAKTFGFPTILFFSKKRWEHLAKNSYGKCDFQYSVGASSQNPCTIFQ